MTMQPQTPIDFAKVESLRRHMALTVANMADFFGVSRETYYNWLRGKRPRPRMEAVLRNKLRILFFVMTEYNWPTPDAIAAERPERYEKLLALTSHMQ